MIEAAPIDVKVESIPPNHKIKTVQLDFRDIVHKASTSNALRKTLEDEAALHGAKLSTEKFDNVIHAIEDGALDGFMMFSENAQHVTEAVGGAVQFPTVFTEWNATDNKFVYYPAVFSEDLYITRAFSQSRHERQSKEGRTNLGHGTTYTLQRIISSAKGRCKDKPFGMVARARIAEHATGNIAIHKIYEKFGAHQETDVNKPVMVFTAEPDIYPESMFNINVSTLSKIVKDGELSQAAIFAVSWASPDLTQMISATFTKAFSTYLGEPVVRVQFVSNGKLRNQSILPQVVTEMLDAGREIAVQRKWYKRYTGSSNVPFHSLRIHALGEDRILSALKTIGASPRKIGEECTMCPAAIDYNNIPKAILGGCTLPTATPFIEGAKTAIAAYRSQFDSYRQPTPTRSSQIFQRAP